jgi:hypothetical protein
MHSNFLVGSTTVACLLFLGVLITSGNLGLVAPLCPLGLPGNVKLLLGYPFKGICASLGYR